MGSYVLDIYQRVLARADEDDRFRERLLADGRRAIEEEFQVTIPAGVQIVVEEATRGELKLALAPKRRLRAGGELSTAELDKISGGAICLCMHG